MREATTTTAREVIGKTYLSITDVQTVLGMTREPARILFQKVKAREKEKLIKSAAHYAGKLDERHTTARNAQKQKSASRPRRALIR